MTKTSARGMELCLGNCLDLPKYPHCYFSRTAVSFLIETVCSGEKQYVIVDASYQFFLFFS